jgi:hypothetical protein
LIHPPPKMTQGVMTPLTPLNPPSSPSTASLSGAGPQPHRYPVGPTFTLPAPCQAWEQPATPQTLQPELLVLETAHRSHSQAVLLPHR